MNDEIIEEWGTDTGISFFTKNGIISMEPGKIYDKNLNENPECSNREELYKECEEIGHMNTWMPNNQVLCLRCGVLNA